MELVSGFGFVSRTSEKPDDVVHDDDDGEGDDGEEGEVRGEWHHWNPAY